MAKSSFQKLKTTYVMLYLLQNSDEEHPVTTQQIIDYLEGKEISAERKSIYSDIEALQTMGLDIISVDRDAFTVITQPAAYLNCRNSNCWWTVCNLPSSLHTRRRWS